MNDLITAATSGLFVEVGKVIEHMKAQQERIADLERQLSEHKAARIAYASEFQLDKNGDPDVGNIHANIRALKAQLAAASAPAVEQQPVAWSYECQQNAEGTVWSEFIGRTKPKLTERGGVRNIKPLYAAPQAADTDKVREWAKDAEEFGNALNEAGWEFIEKAPPGGMPAILFNNLKPTLRAAILKYAEKVAASMAAQAPVREVPGWQPIETAPKETWVLVAGQFGHEGWRIKIGTFYDDQWDILGASWRPLFWMPLPAAPVQQEGEKP